MTETDPGLLDALEALIEPATRGDPESPLRWTCKSTRRLADGGGSNGRRSRLWKACLQELADDPGLRRFVCHRRGGPQRLE